MSSWFRMRPLYERRVPCPEKQLREKLSAALASEDTDGRGAIEEEVMHVMTRDDHHFWSPELKARFEPDGSGCRIVGRFGPRSAAWTLFAVIYMHLAFVAIAGTIYAMAQMTLGRAPSALWSVPAALVLAAIVRVVARIGENLGGADIERLRRFVDSAVEARED